MVKVHVVITWDGTGDHKHPDLIEQEFDQEFENEQAAHDWRAEQNRHPFLTVHFDKIETLL